MTSNFHKIDQKTFKDIISRLHFTTLVNILPKLRYIFCGQNLYKSQLEDSFSTFAFLIGLKRWGHLRFLERGES